MLGDSVITGITFVPTVVVAYFLLGALVNAFLGKMLKKILNHKKFIDSNFDTNWLSKEKFF